MSRRNGLLKQKLYLYYPEWVYSTNECELGGAK